MSVTIACECGKEFTLTKWQFLVDLIALKNHAHDHVMKEKDGSCPDHEAKASKD